MVYFLSGFSRTHNPMLPVSILFHKKKNCSGKDSRSMHTTTSINGLICLLLLLFLFSGCTSGSMLIQEADLDRLDQRLADQALMTSKMLELQNQNKDLLANLLHITQTKQDCGELIPLNIEILEKQAKNILLLEKIPARLNAAKACSTSEEKKPAVLPPPRTTETLPTQKIIVGAEEKVRITPPGLVLPARMDTGAETASLDARNIERFERDGERWVRFEIPHPKTGKMIPMEQKLQRKARILQSSTDESERRPVVELSLTIGGTTQLTEFTLTDRSHLTFPILIGRNVLKDVMVVDVSLSNTIPLTKDPVESTSNKTDMP
ncbi:ATP-dependent zinc protease family protein [Desulfobotulus mexicanus]|uniref:ATP-dependent zinc protease n=1 Tax=Desulfobotulus mexicanus TaxID=2586642 RepID=A0A5S5MFP5_9BACT|nr:ATP-dependent zinc protease [Desulfobotulus mexicanus]TYT74455.1 ATP-dependent zinc protease [Desulfobotulus mexicanus]